MSAIGEAVDHPAHYGGMDDPYETIKVIHAWGLHESFPLGNALKYISRASRKGALLEDLKKARWYLDWEISRREGSLSSSQVPCNYTCFACGHRTSMAPNTEANGRHWPSCCVGCAAAGRAVAFVPLRRE